MRIVQITLAACMGTLAIASAASAATVVTFADPTIGGPVAPIFTFTQTGPGAGTIQGGWSAGNLLLQTPGLPSVPDYPNAQFNMPSVASVSSFLPYYFLGSGQINFYNGAQVPVNLLMTITFTSAVLTNNVGLGASDFAGYGVTFSGPIFAGYTSVSNESFSFSFANRQAVASPAGSYTVTSSFTSSADLVIPAPGTIVLLGISGLIVSRRRR